MLWSLAIVTHVFRHNSSVDDPSFHHPVSVMPAMVLLLEHVIITQIYNFIALFIPQNQYGVVKGTGAQDDDATIVVIVTQAQNCW